MKRTFTIALALALLLGLSTPANAGGAPRRYKILKGHDNFVIQLSLDAKGARLASVAQDATVRVWDARRGRTLMKLVAPDTDDFGVIALSPAGDKLAVALGGAIRIYAVSAKKKRGKKKKAATFATLKGHEGEVKTVAFDKEGTTVASCGDDGVKLWSTETTNNIGDLAKGKACLDLAISPTDGAIAALFAKEGLAVFNRESQKANKVKKIAAKELGRVIWSPSGKSLVIRDGDGVIHIVGADGSPKTTKGGFSDDTAYGLAHGGKLLIGGLSNKTIKGFATVTGKYKWSIKGPASVAFMAIQKNIMATASPEGTNHIWLWKIP